MMILPCELCSDGEDGFFVLLSKIGHMGKAFLLSYMPLLDP